MAFVPRIRVLAYTTAEFRDFVATLSPKKPSYERMSLYRMACQNLDHEDFRDIVQAALTPETAYLQSDTEMGWLSRYFDPLKKMTPDAMGMIEVAIRSTIPDIGKRREIIHDFIPLLDFIQSPDDPFWERKRQLLTDLRNAIAKKLKETDDSYAIYLWKRTLEKIDSTELPQIVPSR